MLLFSSKLHKCRQRKKTLGMPVKLNNFKSLFCVCLLTLPLVGTRTSCLPLSNNLLLVSLETNFGKDIPNQEKLKWAPEGEGLMVCISIIYDLIKVSLKLLPG